MSGKWRCQYCGYEQSREARGTGYWHLITCVKNPFRVLSWDGWKIGEVGKLPNKKGK